MSKSLIQQLTLRYGAKALMKKLKPSEREALEWLWEAWARPEQLEPRGTWRTWLDMRGRGAGKTRAGAEWVRKLANRTRPGEIGHLIGKTPGDIRTVMIEGPSGIMNVCPPHERPLYEPSKMKLTFPLQPGNGNRPTVVYYFSAYHFEALRGPQCHWLWADEVGAWKWPTQAWDQAMFGLRLGDDPRALVTTTPRPISVLLKLRKDPTTVITRGSTLDNAANLAGPFLDQILKNYAGTTLGRQEIEGELMEQLPGALWLRLMFDQPGFRVGVGDVPALKRIVVGVDPAVSDNEESDAIGIVPVGLGVDDHLYTLGNYTMKGSPDDWARRACEVAYELDADAIVAEVNQGGDLVERTIRTVDENIRVIKVRATVGKHVRAEPIAAKYEQRKVHHVHDSTRPDQYGDLEDQMCMTTREGYGGSGSPNDMDAHVWACTELLGGRKIIHN